MSETSLAAPSEVVAAPSVALEPRGPGRPSDYTVELATRAVDAYADGASLRSIARLDGMPHVRTLFRWRHDFPEFATALALARECKAEACAEMGLEAVSEPLDLQLDGKVAGAGVTRQGNRANYLKWLAGCLDPATYGAQAGAVVNVAVKVDLGAILPERPLQPMLKDMPRAP